MPGFLRINSSLTANGSQLCMDYHDGKYGVNTDPKRGADTFIPFRSGIILPDEIDYSQFDYSAVRDFGIVNGANYMAGGYCIVDDLVYVDVLWQHQGNYGDTVYIQGFPIPNKVIEIDSARFIDQNTTFKISEHKYLPYNPSYTDSQSFTLYKYDGRLNTDGSLQILTGNIYNRPVHYQFVYRKAT